jgi:hypothetical protein
MIWPRRTKALMSKGGSLDSESSCDSGPMRPSSMDTLLDRMQSRSCRNIASSPSHSSSHVWDIAEASSTTRWDDDAGQRSPSGHQQAWSYMPPKGWMDDHHQDWAAADRRSSTSGQDGTTPENARTRRHRSNSGSKEIIDPRGAFHNRSSSPSLRKRLHLLGLRDEFNRFLAKQSDCAARASRERPVRYTTRQTAPREECSIFAREPAYHKHICIFYLFLLTLVLFRMASEPSGIVIARLERARRVAEGGSLNPVL